MVDKLAIYKEEKMELAPVAFICDLPNHQPIINTPSYDLKKELGHLYSYQTKAYKINEEMTQIDKTEIKQLILRRFKRLSVNELYYAFKMHRMGEFGQEVKPYGSISISFVSTILDMYVEWKRQIRQKNNLELPGSGVNREQSPEEKKKWIVRGVLNAYDAYQEHKMLPSGTRYVYDVLYDIGLLPTDPEIKRKYYERAKESVKMQMHLEKSGPGLDLSKLREIKDVLDNIEKSNNSAVKVQAMKDVVCDYFKKIKRDKLEEILNEKI